MALLSRSSAAPARAGVASRETPPLALVGATVELRLGGEPVTALPDGALWLAEAKALVVSDLHLEKGSAFALRGQMLPPYDTHAALTKLARLQEALKPDIVVSLGDSFHDGGGPARMDARDREALHQMISRCDWVWVEGNHDARAPETLGGVVRNHVQLGAMTLRHEPTGAANEIGGHLHPCAKVAGRGGSVRRRCFATDGLRLVMPAFGAFTGGLNICDDAFAPFFPTGVTALVLGKERVLPVPHGRLLPD